MWTYHPDLLATPVPRYTSYPTAAEFCDLVGAAEQQIGLAAIKADQPVSLYIHIPYCREICWYCGCNTAAANRSQRLAAYLGNLRREIELVSALLGESGQVERVAFGGGSPNAIAPAQFLELAHQLRDRFSIPDSAIWSVELDPRGFDEDFAAAMANVGITRASLGVQTFDPAIQAAIGRVQPTDLIARTTDLLREIGITSLNFDLMYGLPGQDVGRLIDSIDQADTFGADRLAVFGYAHVPHLLPRQRRIDANTLPCAAQRFAQAEAAHHHLTGKGWTGIGFDHFARPADPLATAAREGRIRRNFQGFTDDPCDVSVGLGASSISRLPGALVQNEKSSGRYGLLVGNGRLPATRGILTPAIEVLRGRVIESLLCQGYADLGSLPDFPDIRDRLHPFAKRGLIHWDGGCLRIDPDALPYARSIAAALDPWRQDSAVRFSSAV